MKIVRSHLNYIENTIAQVDSAIDAMVANYKSMISLLCAIPGVGRDSVITIIPKSVPTWRSLVPQSAYAAGQV